MNYDYVSNNKYLYDQQPVFKKMWHILLINVVSYLLLHQSCTCFVGRFRLNFWKACKSPWEILWYSLGLRYRTKFVWMSWNFRCSGSIHTYRVLPTESGLLAVQVRGLRTRYTTVVLLPYQYPKMEWVIEFVQLVKHCDPVERQIRSLVICLDVSGFNSSPLDLNEANRFLGSCSKSLHVEDYGIIARPSLGDPVWKVRQGPIC